MDKDKDRIIKILAKNQSLPFVQRIINRGIYPVLHKDDDIMTHLMSWGESDGRYFAYPQIVEGVGGLKRLSSDEAFDHAMKTREYIEFKKPEEAEFFTKNYKRFWETGDKR